MLKLRNDGSVYSTKEAAVKAQVNDQYEEMVKQGKATYKDGCYHVPVVLVDTTDNVQELIDYAGSRGLNLEDTLASFVAGLNLALGNLAKPRKLSQATLKAQAEAAYTAKLTAYMVTHANQPKAMAALADAMKRDLGKANRPATMAILDALAK